MKKLFLLTSLFTPASLAQAIPPLLPLPSVSGPEIFRAATDGTCFSAPTGRIHRAEAGLLDLHHVSVAEALELIHAHVLREPYVLSPDVLDDARIVSVLWDGKKSDANVFVDHLLEQLGYVCEKKKHVRFIKKGLQSKTTDNVWVYRPQHRSVTFLSELLSPMFTGRFSIYRGVAPMGQASANLDRSAPPGTAASHINRDADTLIFHGPDAEIERLRRLLPQVDVRRGEVMVKGFIYEVGANATEGSAFNIITNMLGGALNVSLDADAPLSNFVRLKNTSIDLIASMLSSDYRFKVVSSPSMRVRSGTQGTFSVGQEVPVLGAIQRSTDRPPLQSIEYRSSGVIFEVLPTVHEGTIELDIRQELSHFVQTKTGVNNSPTLTKRSLATSVNLDDGDLIILGGLADEKQSERRSGPSFLFDWMSARTGESNRSEIVLILQVQKVAT